MGATKKMIDTEYEQEQLWITEILEEAGSYNLRNEVYEFAQKILNEDPEINQVTAFQIALAEWIK